MLIRVRLEKAWEHSRFLVLRLIMHYLHRDHVGTFTRLGAHRGVGRHAVVHLFGSSADDLVHLFFEIIYGHWVSFSQLTIDRICAQTTLTHRLLTVMVDRSTHRDMLSFRLWAFYLTLSHWRLNSTPHIPVPLSTLFKRGFVKRVTLTQSRIGCLPFLIKFDLLLVTIIIPESHRVTAKIQLGYALLPVAHIHSVVADFTLLQLIRHIYSKILL